MGLLSNQTFTCTLDKLAAVPLGQSRSSRHRPRQEQRRLSDADVDIVVAGYRDGLTLGELSTAFGADRRVLARHLERRGIERRGRRLTGAQIDEIEASYLGGLSLSQVGRRVGVAPTTVNYWLRKRGVELRARNGWNR